MGFDAPHTGPHEALFGGTGGEDDTLSQTVATTAGQHYTVDFWLMNDATWIRKATEIIITSPRHGMARRSA